MVDIVLATYNGEAFLEEQLDSLLRQDVPDWRLLARDDGSTDRTVAILERYAARHPDRLLLLSGAGGNLGVRGNFSELLRQATADHIMLCDQDDVWLPEKVRLTREKMLELEDSFGAATPLLVHADFKVVDRELQVLGESGWRYQQADPACNNCNRLLLQNVATGCTVMINRALCNLALPVPAEALMHDWWLALVAGTFGRIGAVPVPLALYRQHGGNELGARPSGIRRLLRQVDDLSAVRAAMVRASEQARAFQARYADREDPATKALLDAFLALPAQSFLQRRFSILKYGFLYCGALRNIGWVFFC